MHPEGELATAAGRAASAIYTVSSFTTTPLEEIVEILYLPLWFQIYVRDDRELLTKALILKAEALGFRALCVTVDTPVAGVRNQRDAKLVCLPDGVNTPHMPGGLSEKKPFTWKDIEWIRSFYQNARTARRSFKRC
ncbi:MAG: alpha-hydroxy-acid oxidizing protein [Spirosomataceae bacterium]